MTDDALREVFLKSEDKFHGVIINVEHWQVSLPNGKTALREVVRHNGAAAIVPVDDEGYVTLVRQHRVVAGRFTWEIPAGKLDSPDEDPFACARRELEEETGLNAENWRLLSRIDTTPGFCTEKIALYLATGLSQHATHPDEDEFLHITRIPLAEAVALCLKGELRDSKTVIGILMAGQILGVNAAPYLTDGTTIQRMPAASLSHPAE
ncbi:MAG: NUDIX hydrolase [Clostridia bacterium]|nr:NUDIX hydrolase [Clostridia bacterium]